MQNRSHESLCRSIRQVKVQITSQRRAVSIQVFAKKDPIRAAKRFVRELGLGSLDYDWDNATIIEGPYPKNLGDLALDPFEADLLCGMLSGEIKTEKLV